jgi:hypothetical protein
MQFEKLKGVGNFEIKLRLKQLSVNNKLFFFYYKGTPT